MAIMGIQFSNAQVLDSDGSTAIISTNVYDAGSAVKLFAGEGAAQIDVMASGIGVTTPNFQAYLVGADNAALTSNPVTLADTGVSPTLTGANLVAYKKTLVAENQVDSKRYYGIFYKMTGNADNAATVDAYEVLPSGGQSAMIT